MPGVLALVLLAVPLIELWLIVQVAERFGILETVVSLIAVAVIGTWLLVREGRATWGRLRAALARGAVPAAELAEGAAILVGGALLLTPGFFTDIFGLLLLVPPTRAIATRGIRNGFRWWLGRRVGRVGRRPVIYDAEATPRRTTKTDPTEVSAPRLPSSERPDASDGSRDKG